MSRTGKWPEKIVCGSIINLDMYIGPTQQQGKKVK
jgi:hypothetical protein